MSSNIVNTFTGENILINDVCGSLMIGDYKFEYSDILPIILHYIEGGMFGHGMITTEGMEAIKTFIKDVSELIEVKNLSSGNPCFIKESEYESCKEYVERVESNG